MIAIYYNEETNKGGVCYSYSELYRATFKPINWEVVILDKLKGNYKEKQKTLTNKAIDTQYLLSMIPCSWYDLANIDEYFSRYGKRYGLLKEFRENGII